ncbi:MAG: hypothetical protein JW958_06450 [Candidatus Eisenbacteria bacterium]|nr:hypothetical protein [Candidatus Eisenbacteria bacterium]
MSHRFLAILVLCVLLPAPLFGEGRPFTELEIQLPNYTGAHARALGMGGAHIAVAEDASALTWNPAGLVRVRRIELTATLTRAEREARATWMGEPDDWGGTENQLGGLTFLYPYPTYRGSLVLAFGVDRLRNDYLRYRRSAVDDDFGFFEGNLARRTHTQLTDGKLSAYTAGVGWDMSPRFSMGVTLSYLRGSLYDEQRYIAEDVADRDPDVASIEDFFLLDSDISGWTGSAGVLYRASSRVRIGGVLGFPRWVTLDRYEMTRLYDVNDDGSTSSTWEESFPPDEEFTYPWWFGLGASYAARGVILAADVRYSDWKELKNDVEGREVYRRPYYRSTTSYAVGAEFLVPWFPLRLRGGYRYEPVPFRLTYWPLSDNDIDESIVGRDPDEIDVAYDQERRVYALGAGYLVGEQLSVDLAWETGAYKRVIEGPDPDLYREERDSDQFLLTMGYRF